MKAQVRDYGLDCSVLNAENPLVIFVSSVMDKRLEDLATERDAAIQAISSLRITRPWAFENAPASSDPPVQTYLEKVDECDLFVLILGSELTDPVEREYQRAVSLGKPRLVFIKNVSKRTPRATEWLSKRQDVKYARFYTSDDLADQVLAAVTDEVVRSHRRLNLQKKDFEELAAAVTSQPVTFMVRTIEAHELKEIAESFPELHSLYPDFENWIDGKIPEIGRGRASAFVARYGQENAGFALVVDKQQGVRKLSTLYMKPRYQGLGIGPRLLYGVIEQAARDKISKLYVTVSEERREQLEGLLSHFGFYVEGVSGRRYREKSWEWVWSKRLVHGLLRKNDISKFVRRYLLEERGFVARRIGSGLYEARHRYDDLGGLRQDTSRLLVAFSGTSRRTCAEANE